MNERLAGADHVPLHIPADAHKIPTSGELLLRSVIACRSSLRILSSSATNGSHRGRRGNTTAGITSSFGDVNRIKDCLILRLT